MTQENTALLDTKKAALIDGMLERIHWQIDCEVKREDVAELIEGLDEYGMAFVSIPQWICASEAQHGVDAYFKGDADSRLIEAARAVVDGRRSSYMAKNGRDVSIEAGDGEKVYLVHSELMFELQSAYEAMRDSQRPSQEIDAVDQCAIGGKCGMAELLDAMHTDLDSLGAPRKSPDGKLTYGHYHRMQFLAHPPQPRVAAEPVGLRDIVEKLAKADCECDSYHGVTNCLPCQASATLATPSQPDPRTRAAGHRCYTVEGDRDAREQALAEWVRKAMRFIDLCDADAAGYDDLHDEAERLTVSGYSLFGANATFDSWCLADLENRTLTAFLDPQSRGQAFDGEGEAVHPDTARLDALRDECWDLRSFAVPTGGDDADVAWRVIGHWMAEPHERTIAEGWNHDPRVAIDAAISKAKPQEVCDANL